MPAQAMLKCTIRQASKHTSHTDCLSLSAVLQAVTQQQPQPHAQACDAPQEASQVAHSPTQPTQEPFPSLL